MNTVCSLMTIFLISHSYPNVSDIPRRMILFQLRAADDYSTKEIHISPGQVGALDLIRWGDVFYCAFS